MVIENIAILFRKGKKKGAKFGNFTYLKSIYNFYFLSNLNTVFASCQLDGLLSGHQQISISFEKRSKRGPNSDNKIPVIYTIQLK